MKFLDHIGWLYTYGLSNQFIRIMRLTIIIITIALMQVSAAGLAQKLSLNFKNVPLEQVLIAVKQQTAYNFVYTEDVIAKARVVNIHVENAGLKEVLELCFKNQPLQYNIEQKTIVIRETETSLLDKAKSVLDRVFLSLLKDVKGHVVDQDGKPLPNASIRVKGKSAVANTNQNGEFEIKGVDEDAVLLVSYVGFKTLEIPVKGAVMPLEIKLNVATGELEEVKVTYSTGYQNIPKERATGSFAQVSPKVLNEQVSANLMTRLEGIVNGLAIDKKKASPELIIRGRSTIQGASGPLIVVDNFPYDGSLDNINPNDVASITVLKDAAASSIWGSRAGNGVIVITTKKGQFNQPLRIDFNANVTTVEKPDLFYLNRILPSDFVDVEQFLFDKKFKFSDTSSANKVAFSPVYETLFKLRSGKISQSEATAQLNEYRNSDVRDQFNKYVYKRALNQQYAVALSGGGKEMSYHFSTGYDRNANELSALAERFSLRSNINYRITEKLSLLTGINYTKSKNTSGKLPFNKVTAKYPYTMLADENGQPLRVDQGIRLGFIDTVGRGKLLNWDYYPLEDYKYSKNHVDMSDFVADAGLQYKFGNGLEVSAIVAR
jgi:TonB-dependent SusC/RagA subfamily outer membrane receptor